MVLKISTERLATLYRYCTQLWSHINYMCLNYTLGYV
jgi:hypothetical protein